MVLGYGFSLPVCVALEVLDELIEMIAELDGLRIR